MQILSNHRKLNRNFIHQTRRKPRVYFRRLSQSRWSLLCVVQTASSCQTVASQWLLSRPEKRGINKDLFCVFHRFIRITRKKIPSSNNFLKPREWVNRLLGACALALTQPTNTLTAACRDSTAEVPKLYCMISAIFWMRTCIHPR